MNLTEKDITNLINYIIQTHGMVKQNNAMLRDIESLLQKFASNVKFDNRREWLSAE